MTQDQQTKVVILAGGLGTRLEEETVRIPKPLVSIGDHPIIWHIMKLISSYGPNEFVICLGYKGLLLKEYFSNYLLYNSNVTFDFSSEDHSVSFHDRKTENWKISLIDTGLNTQTAGRLQRVKSFVGDSTFIFTYGDGVSDVNIQSLLEFHRSHGKLATVTAVQPSGKFGALEIDSGDIVRSFVEKPAGDRSWINGGFMVLESGVFDYITGGDETVWEWAPMENLARDGQLMAFRHEGFWKCMDTLRDKKELNSFWDSGEAPWKVWR